MSKDKGSKGGKDEKMKGNQMMTQMGFDISQIGGGAMSMDDGIEDDSDLEAELMALQGDSGHERARSKSPRPPPKKEPATDISNIENMAAACMQDLDENVSDEDDPELLAELQDIADDDDTPVIMPEKPTQSPTKPQSSSDIVSLLQERLSNYQQALSNAKANNETSKVRRYDRGLKTLEGLLKSAKNGKAVPEDDIPPPVAVGSVRAPDSSLSEPPPLPVLSQPLESQQPVIVDKEKDELLRSRQMQFKQAALHAKNTGNKVKAMEYLKIVKQFDHVIAYLESGQEVDMTQMPEPPRDDDPQTTASSTTTVVKVDVEIPRELPVATDEEARKIFNAPEPPKTVMEALQQRLDKYHSSAESAKAEGSGSKQRRMTRIAKQYEDAIKAYKSNKPVPYDELPTPPGFAPIPTENITGGAASQPPPADVHHMASPMQLSPVQRSPAQSPSVSPSQVSPSGTSIKRGRTSSLQDKQISFLTERQKLFRQAALDAKNRGDSELAKRHLRSAKGFDPMIQACEAGLPVDLSKVPAPPGADETGFEIIQMSDTELGDMGDREQIYKTLENTLIEQIRTCSANSQHFVSLGDVSTASRFDKNGQNCRKDLESLRNAHDHNDPVPRFHYENRTYSMVQCCSELGDNDLEVVIVRGLHYGLPGDYAPKDLDTYVKSELGYPTESAQKNDTSTAKGTDNPEYNQSFKLQINRKSRAFLRFVKIKAIKFEIFYKRGFLKSDKCLGTVSVKLAPLETKCELHDSYDLMDGRKTVGGKLEIKLRVREPFITKQVEEIKEKWLVIDEFIRSMKQPSKQPQKSPNVRKQAPQPPMASAHSPSNQVQHSAHPQQVTSSGGGSITSNEVLKFEMQQLEYQLSKYQRQLNESQQKTLHNKLHLLQRLLEQQQDKLRRGGHREYSVYISQIEVTVAHYEHEARSHAQKGQRDKAQISLRKKKLVESEVIALKSKLRIQ